MSASLHHHGIEVLFLCVPGRLGVVRDTYLIEETLLLVGQAVAAIVVIVVVY